MVEDGAISLHHVSGVGWPQILVVVVVFCKLFFLYTFPLAVAGAADIIAYYTCKNIADIYKYVSSTNIHV